MLLLFVEVQSIMGVFGVAVVGVAIVVSVLQLISSCEKPFIILSCSLNLLVIRIVFIADGLPPQKYKVDYI